MFQYFAGNYAWDLSIALSIAMRGEIAEIDAACRPLLSLSGRAGPAAQNEAWFQSWMRIAEHVDCLGIADQEVGSSISGAAKRFRAANYFLIAERNMPWSDPRRSHAYRKATAAFHSAAEACHDQIEYVEVPYEDGSLSGWLCQPSTPGPHPCVIMVNGLDDLKEIHQLMFARTATARGLAILFVDQEGTGEAVRLQFHPKRHDSETSTGLFLDALEERPDIDSSRVAILGLSAGGYDAPRAAAIEKRLVCAASIGGLYNLDTHRDMFLGRADQSSSEGLSDQRAHLRHVTGAVTDEEAVASYERRSLEGILDKVTVPLLISHGENDRQVPLWHAERTIAEATNSPSAELRVFSIAEGSAEHCGLDNASMQGDYVFDWLARTLSEGPGHD